MALDAPKPSADAAAEASASQDAAADSASEVAAALPACQPPPDVDHPIPLLTATGCVDPARPLQPAPGLIYYEVASPLWSDGAAKDRWVSIPAGEQVALEGAGGVIDPGHFRLPPGTVVMKHFSLDGKRVETRLITRGPDGWGTYSYRWNEQQTEAVVIGPDEGAVAREVVGPGGKQIWTYPARSDCTKCHTEEAGFQLGLDLVQLNTAVRYPDGATMNQLASWQRRGLLPMPPGPLPSPLPSPGGTAGTLEQRARSYLQANCAGCHRPGSQNALMDLRWTTSFGDTDTCDVAPAKGDLGVPGARRIVPGQPALSLVSLRMRTLRERFRMPQIGTGVVDLTGAQVVDDWIASLTGCPPRR
jgi:uncharacterized repeat protein (TIGR03806 family)